MGFYLGPLIQNHCPYFKPQADKEDEDKRPKQGQYLGLQTWVGVPPVPGYIQRPPRRDTACKSTAQLSRKLRAGIREFYCAEHLPRPLRGGRYDLLGFWSPNQMSLSQLMNNTTPKPPETREALDDEGGKESLERPIAYE